MTRKGKPLCEPQEQVRNVISLLQIEIVQPLSSQSQGGVFFLLFSVHVCFNEKGKISRGKKKKENRHKIKQSTLK